MLCWCARVLQLGVLVLTVAAQINVNVRPCETEGYGPPRNLTAMPVGYFALNVSWEPPDVEPQYYAVAAYSIYGRKDVNTSNTFVLFEDLRCCCTYTILAVSFYGDDEKCYTSIDATPNQPLPKQPDSCSIHIWDSTTVEVTEHGGGDDCPLSVRYITNWSWVVLWSNETGNYTGGSIYTAQPYTNVTATVFVNSPNATGTPPSCWVMTPQTQSSPPTNLSITSQTHKTRTVSWSLPDYINGVLKGWLLNWGTLGGALDGQVQLEPHYRAYSMEDIDPANTYEVNIMAINGEGLGSPGSIWITHERDPGLTTSLAVGGLLIGIAVLVGIYGCYIKIKQRRAASRT